MKKMNKIPAMIGAIAMIISALINLLSYASPLIHGARLTPYIILVNIVLATVASALFAVALFRGKKDILGTVFLGAFAVVYLIIIVGSFTIVNLLNLLVFIALAVLCTGVLKLPKGLGGLIVAGLAGLLAVLSLINAIRNLTMIAGGYWSDFLRYNFGVFLRMLFLPIFRGAAMIMAALAVGTEAKEKAVPQPFYGQAPYQPMADRKSVV